MKVDADPSCVTRNALQPAGTPVGPMTNDRPNRSVRMLGSPALLLPARKRFVLNVAGEGTAAATVAPRMTFAAATGVAPNEASSDTTKRTATIEERTRALRALRGMRVPPAAESFGDSDFDKTSVRLAARAVPEQGRARFAALAESDLRSAGLTRQKSSYIRGLAVAIVAGEFDPTALTEMDDESARIELIKLRGVGAWTADIYLLMALGRADIWPSGDLALVAAIREVKRMRSLPSVDRVARITRGWSPWRAVAARVLWHHYLSTPRTRGPVSAAKPSSRRTPAPSRRPAPKGPRSVRRSTKPSRAKAAAASSRSMARTPRGGRTRV